MCAPMAIALDQIANMPAFSPYYPMCREARSDAI